MTDTDTDRLAGTLLGTALGDALGLPYEGLRPAAIRRRTGGAIAFFRLLPGIGIVSDDTEQSALLLQSLLRARAADGSILPDRAVCHFRRALAGWFLRLPFGTGLATTRACLRLLCGCARSGVRSAGNGAAMRAPVLGVLLADDQELRRTLGRAVAEVTHTDPRAVEGTLFAAELAALAARAAPAADRNALARQALSVVAERELLAALTRALEFAAGSDSDETAAASLGTSGYIVHSLPLALFAFVRHGAAALAAIQCAIRAGGDTDTTAAIAGAWCGALHGAQALPAPLVTRLCPGPYGTRHLTHLAATAAGTAPVPPHVWPLALLRNLLLYPVILAHAARRLLPW